MEGKKNELLNKVLQQIQLQDTLLENLRISVSNCIRELKNDGIYEDNPLYPSFLLNVISVNRKDFLEILTNKKNELNLNNDEIKKIIDNALIKYSKEIGIDISDYISDKSQSIKNQNVEEIKNLNYDDFYDFIQKEYAKYDSINELHFQCLKLIELSNTHKKLTSEENIKIFNNYICSTISKTILGTTTYSLNLNKDYLNESPNTKDFKSRQEALEHTINEIKKLSLDNDSIVLVKKLELEIQLLFNKNRKNCYIATLAYGDINHPKVELFRGFRDNTLSKNQLGRTFIKYYYRYSPILVKVLEPCKNLNKIIRFFLNIIIKSIQ